MAPGRNAMLMSRDSRIFVLITLLAFSFSCICPSVVSAQNSFAVHNLNTGYSFAAIQEAIDDNSTLGGHVIWIDSGVYHERISVSKAVSLTGENSSSTIIDAQGKGTVIDILVSNVTVANLTIRDGGSVSGTSGIHVYNSSYCNVSNNIIDTNFYGIWLASCTGIIVSDNDFTNNSYAIYVDSSSNNSISRNSFSANDFAVWISDVDDLDFELNNVSSNNYGVWITQSVDVSLSDNRIVNNTDGVRVYSNSSMITLRNNTISSSKDRAVFLSGCSNSSLTDSHVLSMGREAVYLQSAEGISLTGNTVSSSGYDGVHLYQSDGNVIEGNLVSEAKSAITIYSSADNYVARNDLIRNDQGLILVGSDNDEILQNDILQNDCGIDISNSRNVKVKENNVTGNTNEGIVLAVSSGNNLLKNTVSTSGKGIILANSSDNLIADNEITKCGDGMQIGGSQRNTALNNNISFNNGYGLVLSGSSNNTVSGNTLTNNTVGICLSESSIINTVSGNILAGNSEGVSVERSNSNRFYANRLTGNVDGVRLLGSRNNTLELNRVSSGVGTGIYVADSNFNFFFHNGFFNNSLKSASANSSNLWDDGFEGNFWGYEGFVDAEQNGIADNPFVLGNGDKDNFPLMAEYTQFTVLMDNYTYAIGVVCNSTISDFRYFRLPENFTSQISFRASAFEGSFEGLGLCRIAIPHALTRPQFEVTVDNNPPLNQRILVSNGTHSWLYFSFPYFGGEVRIVTAAPAPPFWTELWFWGIVALTIIVGGLALAVFLFNRRLGSYRKTIEEFEKRLREKETSPLETARKLFNADVEERSLKIGKFEEKYGVRIRPRNSLEDVFRGLDLKKKEKEEKKDEVNS